MKYLLFKHSRNLFVRNEWKPGIKKWYKNPRSEGCICGRGWGWIITVSNWGDIKESIPKSYRPLYVGNSFNECKNYWNNARRFITKPIGGRNYE